MVMTYQRDTSGGRTLRDINISKMMITLQMWILRFFMLYPGPSPVGGMMAKAWMCTLNAIPAENVTVPSVHHIESEKVIRHLLRGPEMDAIRLPRSGNIKCRTHSDNESTIYLQHKLIVPFGPLVPPKRPPFFFVLLCSFLSTVVRISSLTNFFGGQSPEFPQTRYRKWHACTLVWPSPQTRELFLFLLARRNFLVIIL